MGLLLRWLAPFLAILLAAYLLPGEFAVQDYGAAAVFALVLALLNAFVRPVVVFFTLPLTCLTLGIFHLIINALFFLIAAWLVPGVEVAGFFAALIGAILVAAVSLATSMFVR